MTQLEGRRATVPTQTTPSRKCTSPRSVLSLSRAHPALFSSLPYQAPFLHLFLLNISLPSDSSITFKVDPIEIFHCSLRMVINSTLQVDGQSQIDGQETQDGPDEPPIRRPPYIQSDNKQGKLESVQDGLFTGSSSHVDTQVGETYPSSSWDGDQKSAHMFDATAIAAFLGVNPK